MSEEEKKREAARDDGNWRKKLETREEMLRFLRSLGVADSGQVNRQKASFK